MTLGKLILVPNAFTDTQPLENVIPVDYLKEKLKQVNIWALESRRSGFRMIAKLKDPLLKDIPFYELNEHTKLEDINILKEFLLGGKTIGVISDAGMPCIADPGSSLVSFCRQKCIKVEYVIGPSSIPLAIALSGLSGQRFFFEGYLPKNEEIKKARVLELLQRSEKEQTTMVFIEAPYRNEQLFSFLEKLLPKKAFLSVAVDLTLDTEEVYTSHPGCFNFNPNKLQDRPAIFLFGFS